MKPDDEFVKRVELCIRKIQDVAMEFEEDEWPNVWSIAARWYNNWLNGHHGAIELPPIEGNVVRLDDTTSINPWWVVDEAEASKKGLHNPTGEAEFEVFLSTQYPDLKLETGWYWDVPACRLDCASTPRGPDGLYHYANGPYPTSQAAYDAAMVNDGDLDA